MSNRVKVTPPTPQAVLSAMHAQYGTWAWVAIKLHDLTGKRFDRALLSRIAAGRQNAPNSVRLALNLPALAPAPVCLTCGEVHVKTGRCPHAPKPQRKPRYRPTVREVRGYAALVLALLAR